MSHIVYVKTTFKDVAALREACTELGVELESDGLIRGFGRTLTHADLRIRLLSEIYDLGFVRESDGNYCLVGDDMLLTGAFGYESKVLGKACNLLRQQYSLSLLKREAARKGMMFRFEKVDKQLRVTMSKI